MGEAFDIWNATKKLRLWPSQYDTGSKWQEHARNGNSFLYELLHLLKDEWKGDRLSYVGEYNMDIPSEYDGKYEVYRDRESVLSYYQDSMGLYWLEEEYQEQLPGLWQELIDEYVLVNYDKGRYCEIDYFRAHSYGQDTCPLLLLISNYKVGADEEYIFRDEHREPNNWCYNHVGLERKDSEMLRTMQSVQFQFR